MIEIALTTLGIISLGILQVSFLTTWPEPVSSLNVSLALIIFMTVIINYRRALWWAFGISLFLELFSGDIFGATLLSTVGMVVTINALFNNFFTNRSLYSLMILGFFGSVVYTILRLGIIVGAALISIPGADLEFDWWVHLFWQPIFTLLILLIIFFTYQSSTGRLRNFFLSSLR